LKNKEEWRPIIEYEGSYEISNYGRVKSNKRYELILKTTLTKNGYLGISIRHNGGRKFELVHRLVAKAFIPNPHNYPQVNHKDEVKTNNNVTNLEWCTNSYNINYGTGIEKRRVQRFIPINCFSKDGEFIKAYPSLTSAKEDGYCKKGISGVLNKKRKTYKGFVWRYADD